MSSQNNQTESNACLLIETGRISRKFSIPAKYFKQEFRTAASSLIHFRDVQVGLRPETKDERIQAAIGDLKRRNIRDIMKTLAIYLGLVLFVVAIVVYGAKTGAIEGLYYTPKLISKGIYVCILITAGVVMNRNSVSKLIQYARDYEGNLLSSAIPIQVVEATETKWTKRWFLSSATETEAAFARPVSSYIVKVRNIDLPQEFLTRDPMTPKFTRKITLPDDECKPSPGDFIVCYETNGVFLGFDIFTPAESE